MFFQNFFYQPIYNLFVFILTTIAHNNLIITIILFAVILKIIFIPFSVYNTKQQRKQQLIKSDVDAINKKHSDNLHKKSEALMELYKINNIKPFTTLLLLLIQIPFIIAAALLIIKENIEVINTDILYSFIAYVGPLESVWGPLELGVQSIILACVAGGLQYILLIISFKSLPMSRESIKRIIIVVLTILTTIFAFVFTSTAALYWISFTFISILYEVSIKKLI